MRVLTAKHRWSWSLIVVECLAFFSDLVDIKYDLGGLH